MEKRIILDSIPESYKFKKLGSGHNGTAYLTKDGKVYKEYHTEGIDDEITDRLVGLKYEGFTFPESLVIVDGKFKGFIKEFVEGKSLDELDLDNTDVYEFLIALKKFETELQELSYEEDLDVYDLNPNNLVYTDDGRIVDIDTDPMHPFTYPVGNPYYENQKELAETLNRIFFSGEFKSMRLQQLQKEILIGGYIKPSVFISEALEKMDKVIEVKSISDYQKGLSLLRK